MSSVHPLIGITASEQSLPSPSGGPRPVALVPVAFLALATDHGGCPLVIPGRAGLEDAPGLARILDGLILTGGQDVDPASYGQAPKVEYLESVRGHGAPFRRAAGSRPDRRRDELEISLYRACRELCVPVLGICRGLQIINVAEGGTLHQELPATATRHHFDEDGWVNHHEIEVEPGTLARKLLDVDRYYTSSMHHQGVDRLGTGLRASAHAPDGMVEMIESADPRRFVMATHGHLELTRANLPRYEAILRAFMDRAREVRRARG